MELVSFLNSLVAEGLATYGFSNVEGLTHPRYAQLPYAVSLVFALSHAVVEDMAEMDPPRPTYAYFQHYRAVNQCLDQYALRVAAYIERAGFRALPVAASQTVHDQGEAYSGLFAHKTAAVRAGLGWIGKSALFISDVYGPRVRLATVLTDCRLPEAGRAMPSSRCGDCTACVTACPAQAITGVTYTPGMPRSALFDAQACGAYMRRHFMHIGRGAVCGICLSVCPYGQCRPLSAAE